MRDRLYSTGMSRIALELVVELFERRGGRRYSAGAISLRSHLLQTAALAERDGADAPLVTAALLHDVDQLLSEDSLDQDGTNAAAWLAEFFADEVVEPVRLTVPAHRYLCTVDSRYASQRAPWELEELEELGGRLLADEIEEFRELAHGRAAVRLRRWDDRALALPARLPGIDRYLPYLVSSLLDHTAISP